MCHTRELAYQIRDEYNRFSKYMPDIKTGVFYGGTPIKTDIETLKNKDTCPHIIVGTSRATQSRFPWHQRTMNLILRPVRVVARFREREGHEAHNESR